MTGHQAELMITITSITIMQVPFCMQMALYDGRDGGHRSIYVLFISVVLSLFLAWVIARGM